MQPVYFSENPNPSIAILIKDNACKMGMLKEHYTYPLNKSNISSDLLSAYPLHYPTAKPSAKIIDGYLAELLPEIESQGIDTLYVPDANYFKRLTKEDKKVDAHFGYVKKCAITGYEHINVILGASYASLFYNPGIQTKIDQSLQTVIDFIHGNYLPPGSRLFDKYEKITDFNRIKQVLEYLFTKPSVSADIEGLSLDFWKAGISTIAFAVDEEEGYAFAVDTHGGLGLPVRNLLKTFFSKYQGTTIWHNAAYDLKVIIYELFMSNELDYDGMLNGIDIMTKNFHDSQVIAYLALNSCVRIKYSLKDLAQDFAGNYAEDVTNIMLIPEEKLLKYNFVDSISTWYVFKKYYQKMIDDNQNDVYVNLMKPTIQLLLQIELTGMPISMEKVLSAEKELADIQTKYLNILHGSSIVQSFNSVLQQKACDKKNSELKVKRVTLTDFADVQLNPNSSPQLQILLYEYLGLPIIDKTKKKQPATGTKTLKKLAKQTNDSQILELLDALIELSKVDKILTAFIPAFKNAWLKSDGHHYLHGNYRIGGTVSGRLSCAKPNMQQMPSGSTYGKLIKDCFVAPKGKIFAGADFNSLEDRISALTTKDPNKLKVYMGVVIYELNINGIIHHIRDDDTIEYDGKLYTGAEFYAAYRAP